MCWLLLPHTAADADKITPDQLVGDKGEKLIFPALKSRKRKTFASPVAAMDAFFAAYNAQSKQVVKDGR
jgi:hypothetical protein